MKKILILALSILLLPTATFAVKCKDFKTHSQAQAYFNAKKPGYKKLDRDHDGSACDCLPGGSAKHCPKKKR